ncbi:MAG: hypothetical protein ACOZCL_12105 [Bacillota bacterium]
MDAEKAGSMEKCYSEAIAEIVGFRYLGEQHEYCDMRLIESNNERCM